MSLLSCSVKECAKSVKQDEHTQEVTTSKDHEFKVLVNFIDTYMISKVLLRYADILNRLNFDSVYN